MDYNKILEYNKRIIKKSDKLLKVTEKYLNNYKKKIKEEFFLILKLKNKNKEVQLIFEKLIINSKIKPTKALFCLKMFSLDNDNFKQENLNSIYEGLVSLDTIKYKKQTKYYYIFFKLLDHKLKDKFIFKFKISQYNKCNYVWNLLKNQNFKKKKKLKKIEIFKWILMTNFKKFKVFYKIKKILNNKIIKIKNVLILNKINNIINKIKLKIYNKIWNKLLLNINWNTNYKFYAVLLKVILKKDYFYKKLFFNKIKIDQISFIKGIFILNNLFIISIKKKFMIIKYYNKIKYNKYYKIFLKILNSFNNKLNNSLNHLNRDSLISIKIKYKFINIKILISFIKIKKINYSFNKIKYYNKYSKENNLKKLLNLNMRLKKYNIFKKLIINYFKKIKIDKEKLIYINNAFLNLEIKFKLNKKVEIYKKLFLNNIQIYKSKKNHLFNLINMLKYLYNKRIVSVFNKLKDNYIIELNDYYLYIGFDKIHYTFKLKIKNYFEEIKWLSKNRFFKVYYNSIWKWKLENNNTKLYKFKKNYLQNELKNYKKINNLFEFINNLFIIKIKSFFNVLKNMINYNTDIIKLEKNEFNNMINKVVILSKILFIFKKNKNNKINFYFNVWRNNNNKNNINNIFNHSLIKNKDYYEITSSDDKELLNYLNDLKGIFNFLKNLLNKIYWRRMKIFFLNLKNI